MRLNLYLLTLCEVCLIQSTKSTDYLSKGILFNEKSKILLAEKFVNIEFLVPFPEYNFTTRASIQEMLTKLAEMWKLPSVFCPLDFSSHFNSTTEPFNLNWMLQKTISETTEAQREVDSMREETATFLTMGEENERKRREAHVGAALMAGIGLFGGGILMGNSGSCGFAGIFGNCQDQGRKNAENIAQLNEYASVLTDHVLEVESEANEKFFLISNELEEIQKIQNEIMKNQNENWKIIEDQFEVIEKNFHLLRDCTQMLFSNQQLNFNFDTVASLLSILYADIKSYRSALYAYKVNLLNSIPILLSKRLPMSLVPKSSLMAILNSVYDSQKDATDRLTLAIPMQDLLSYYDAELLSEVSTITEGLLLTLSIPLSSSQTAFNVYQAHLIPMPQLDSSEALRWVTEGPYLAISEDSMETTVLTEQQY